jgi:hypothetical protein
MTRKTKLQSLKKVAPHLWQSTGYAAMFPPTLPCVMTVVRTAKGLLLHSVIEPTAATVEEVKALGIKVHCIFVPSCLHDTHASKWSKAFPEAKLVCPKPIIADIKECKGCEDKLEASEQVLAAMGVKTHDVSGHLREGFAEWVLEVPTGNKRNGKQQQQQENKGDVSNAETAYIFCDVMQNQGNALLFFLCAAALVW